VIQPPTSPVQFDDDGVPRSRLFDDVYFSRDDGLAESRAVFLTGCGLPGRWAGRRQFTVAELGFGTGLNILALLDLWRASAPAGGHLSIFSVEAHPLNAEAAARALSRWPEIAATADRLLRRWPGRRAGFHRVDFPDLRATLDLAVMEASEALGAWSGPADAWFLDGFAPARNPEMWSDSLMALVARRSAPGARAATYTVAGQVRRGLAAAGFEVERQPGFGRKRERLEARLAGAAAEGPPASPEVAIIGAGVAGASLARAFAALGLPARLFDAERPGAGASGNPAALVMPGLDAGLGPAAQLHAAAFARATALYDEVPGAVIARGALQLEGQARDGPRFAAVAASALFEPGALAPLSAEETPRRLGEPAPPGLDLRQALVIEPASVVAAWAPEVHTARIGGLVRDEGVWRLLDGAGREVARSDLVCLAMGADLGALWPEAPLTPVRGQLSWTDAAAAPVAVAWGGYVAPTRTGLLFGATHDRGDRGADWRAGDDARNLAELTKRLPGLAARVPGRAVRGRASVRAATPDSLPLVGSPAPGLWVLGGLGSRGFTLAPLMAEHLAALAVGAPSPLPARLARLVDPDRFVERARRRAGLPRKSF
jgi:tRNA 5-methylaminomethyl-2-thiouridine biosynthesis bifunctional protein